MPDRPSRVYGGVPAEERRAERRRKLLEAGLEIIGTQGWAAATIRGVCSEAGVGPRFFYESFDTLEDLAVELFDEIAAAGLGRLRASIDTAPERVEARVRAATEGLAEEFFDDPRRARLLFIEALACPALHERRMAVFRSAAELWAAQLPSVPDEAARFLRGGAIGVAAGVAEMLHEWNAGAIDLSREEVIDLLTELVLAVIDRSAAFGLQAARDAAGR